MGRVGVSRESAAPWVPERPTLRKLQAAAKNCRGCQLWKRGTQTVFGQGTRASRVVFVGEQPGDREDVEGRPFVGPAGKLLDRALAEAGIDRSLAYVTNVVKHFKWEPRGKKRIHQKPNAVEISACRPWLDAELAVVKPKVLVCLGATAAQEAVRERPVASAARPTRERERRQTARRRSRATSHKRFAEHSARSERIAGAQQGITRTGS